MGSAPTAVLRLTEKSFEVGSVTLIGLETGLDLGNAIRRFLDIFQPENLKPHFPEGKTGKSDDFGLYSTGILAPKRVFAPIF